MIESSLHWADYLVLALFLLISLGIGVYHSLSGGRQRTTTEFIMANRSLGVIPTALSLMVSFQSAIMILSGTSEFYMYGAQHFVMMNFTILIACIGAERIIVPWIFPLQLVSVYEYLDLRFNSKTVRAVGASFGILSGIAYMGTAMYAPSVALQSVTGLSIYVSIPMMAIVSITYTALGGMRAVIWTDVFQFGVMMIGIAVILTRGLVVVGGFEVVSNMCSEQGRLIWTNWSPDPRERHTVWGFLIGFGISWMFGYGLSQASVQRYSATTSLAKAKSTILLNIPCVVVLHLIVCYTGFVVVSYYAQSGCDPVANNQIENANHLLPYFVTTQFSNVYGFTGLFLATLYGGALSSVSSSLSGAAANCWEDIMKWKLNDLREETKALITKCLVVFFGLISTTLSFLASVLPGPLNQVSMSFYGSIAGPSLGMFILGGTTKIANAQGILIGCACAFIFNLWINFGSHFVLNRKYKSLPPLPTDKCWSIFNETISDNDHQNITNYHQSEIITSIPIDTAEDEMTALEALYSISYIWLTVIGALVTVIIGLLASIPFRNKNKNFEVDDRLLISWKEFFNFSYKSGSDIQKTPFKEKPLNSEFLNGNTEKLKEDSRF